VSPAEAIRALPWRLWLLLWLACLVALRLSSHDAALLQVRLDAEADGVAQVYFDRGAGLSEADSLQRPIRRGSNLLNFPLPQGEYRGLRLDPTNNAAGLTLRQVLIWVGNQAIPIDLLPSVEPAANVAIFEHQAGGIRAVPTPATTDPQLSIARPLHLDAGGHALALDLWRSLLLAGLLAACARLAAAASPDVRGLVAACGAAAAALILALALSSTRSDTAHPDEMSHLVAVIFHMTHGLLPPRVDDPALAPSISPYGFSYLFELDVVYPAAAAALSSLGVSPQDAVVAARLFNASLWGLLFAAALARRSWTPLLAVPLASPQIWYVFSYFNGDALPFVGALLAAALAADREGGVAAYLSEGRVLRRDTLLLCASAALLLVSKRNYLVVVPLLLLWLAARELGLKASEAAAIVLGLALAGCGAALRSPLFGTALPGGPALLGAGLGVAGLAGVVFLRRTLPDPLLRQRLRRWLLLAACILALAAPRLVWDIHQNGPPASKRATIAQIQEQRAQPQFKSSVIEHGGGYYGLSLIRKGVSLPQVVGAPWHWLANSVRSAFGVYGYMSIFAPTWVYGLLLANFALLGGLALWALFRHCPEAAAPQAVVVLGGAVLVCLASLLHSWVNDFQAQGRYLFPAAALFALPLVAAGPALPRRLFRACVLIGGVGSALAFAFVAIAAFGNG